MHPALIEILNKADKLTVQRLVKDHSVERLGYIYHEVIEEYFKVKKGTSDFGMAVSDLFAEYKLNKVRAYELEALMKVSKDMYKNSYSPDLKREWGVKYNDAVNEFNELVKPTTKFVKVYNKLLKEKSKI